MTIQEYQTLAHSTACHGGTLAYPISALSEEYSEVGAVWGNYVMDAPSMNFPWEVARAKLLDEIGDVIWNIAELATLLKLDLDTEVFGLAQRLSGTGTRDITVLLLGAGTYVGKISGAWAKYIRKHDGTQISPEDAATNVRVGEEKDFGVVVHGNLVALTAAILELIYRLELPIQDVLEFNIAKLAKRKQNNTLGGAGSVERGTDGISAAAQ